MFLSWLNHLKNFRSNSFSYPSFFVWVTLYQGCLLKFRFSGCAPMYRKCRLHSNGNSKSSYDVADYWRKMKWQHWWWERKEFSLTRANGENSFSPTPLSSPRIPLHFPPISYVIWGFWGRNYIVHWRVSNLNKQTLCMYPKTF